MLSYQTIKQQREVIIMFNVYSEPVLFTQRNTELVLSCILIQYEVLSIYTMKLTQQKISFSVQRRHYITTICLEVIYIVLNNSKVVQINRMQIYVHQSVRDKFTAESLNNRFK